MGKEFAFLFLLVIGVSCSRGRGGSVLEMGIFSSVPISFSTHAKMELEIQGEKCFCEVDTGASCDLALLKEVLDKVENKESRGLKASLDFTGKDYVSNAFLIPEIKIGLLAVSNLIAKEESLEFRLHGEIYGAQETFSRSSGRIGNGFFRSFYCLFDFPHSVICLAKEITDQQVNSLFKHFIRVPFQIERGLIVISGEIDFGVKRFVLDTGSTHSILKRSVVMPMTEDSPPPGKPVLKNKQLVLNHHHLGPCRFFVTEFGAGWEDVDGILGLDFFMSHALFFDFKNNEVWVSP